ncbi:MAG: hypothetical protein IT534_12840 [Bauldia sp.]|nr:hypothetical protein [Bauldia sp.]
MSVADLGARSPLGPILAELAGARRRAGAFALFGAASIGVAAGLGTFCVLEVAFALVGHEWPWLALAGLDGLWPATAMPAPVGAHALAGVAVAVVIFLAALVGELRGRPGVSLLARRADRTFALKERVSTAMEVATRGDDGRGSLETALLLDIAARSGAVSRRTLVPFRAPAAAIVAAVLLVVAVALVAFGVATREAAAPVPVAPETPITAAERAEVAEDVRRIAALIAADAEQRTDPYLAAVARELGTAAEAIAAGEARDRTAIADELRRLLPYAAAAYAGAGVAEGAPQNLAGLIEAAARGVEAPAPAATAPMTGGLPPNAAAPAGPGNAIAGGGPTDATQPTLDALLDALERPETGPRPTIQGPLGAAPAGAVEAEEEPYFNPLQMQGGTPPGAEGNQPGQFIGGAPAGAAAEAGLAEGDAVGGGARPLGDGVVTEFGALPTPTEEMVLGDPRAGDGRRIRLDAPAAADGTVLAAGERTDGAGWQRLPEQAVARTLLPPALLDVLSRYFKPAPEAGE